MVAELGDHLHVLVHRLQHFQVYVAWLNVVRFQFDEYEPFTVNVLVLVTAQEMLNVLVVVLCIAGLLYNGITC
jgi:hypothetical protein